MKFANLSKLGNAIIDISIKGQDKNRNIESITMLLNAIRISSFKYNDIQIKITAESKKITAPFKVPLLNWKLNRLVNNGIKEMESINKYANTYGVMDVFDNCNISDPTSRKIYFDEESKEYANAVFEDVLENSLAKSNPDIESPENDREYFLRRIVGYQIQEKEIKTPTEELSKTHQKGEEKIKENQKENTIKKGLPKTIEELVEIARKEKENDDINNPGNGQNPNPGSNGPGSSNGEPDR